MSEHDLVPSDEDSDLRAQEAKDWDAWWDEEGRRTVDAEHDEAVHHG